MPRPLPFNNTELNDTELNSRTVDVIGDLDSLNSIHFPNSDLVSAINAVPSMMDKTFYVDAVNGNDSNDGSSTAPFKTIQKAVDSVPVGGKGPIYLKEGQTFDINANTDIYGKVIFLWKWGTAKPKLRFHPNTNGHWTLFLYNAYLRIQDIDIELLPATDTNSSKYIGAFHLIISAVHFHNSNIFLDSTTMSFLTVVDNWSNGFGAISFYASTITTNSKGYVLLLKNSTTASLYNSSSSIDNSNYWVSGILRDGSGSLKNLLTNIDTL